jgi:hypothetical protein
MCNKYLLLLTFSILLFSCKKDGTPPPVVKSTLKDSLTGTWNFISERVENFYEDTYVSDSDIYRYTINTGYLSRTARGRLIIDAGIFRYDSTKHTVDSVAIYTTYHNGILEDSTTAPIQGSVQVANYSAPYTLPGTDSIHLSEGIQIIDGVISPVAPTGYNIRWSGDTLLLVSQSSSNIDTIKDGVLESVNQFYIQTRKYVKQ